MTFLTQKGRENRELVFVLKDSINQTQVSHLEKGDGRWGIKKISLYSELESSIETLER